MPTAPESHKVVSLTERHTRNEDRQKRRTLHTYSKRWRYLRMKALTRDLFRCPCGAEATEVDHRDGNHGNNELGNLQSLCKPCHSSKTARENHGFGN